MRVKQPKGSCAHEVDVMRKIRRRGDQEVLQQEQAESDEPHKFQILELIQEHIEGVLRPSQDQGRSEFNAMPYDERGEHDGAQSKPDDRHYVAKTIRKA